MFFGYGYGLYLLFSLPALLLGLWAQFKVQSAFKKFSQVRTYVGLTGGEVARRILDYNGLNDIPVFLASQDLAERVGVHLVHGPAVDAGSLALGERAAAPLAHRRRRRGGLSAPVDGRNPTEVADLGYSEVPMQNTVELRCGLRAAAN